MLLSEMFGVDRDTDFGVKGYELLFKVTLNVWGEECLMFNLPCISAWEPVSQGLLCSVIFAAPSGIIHLPPPLTDEQMEQLRALFTIGYLYLAKDKDETVYAYEMRPHKVCKAWYYENGDSYMLCTKQTVCLNSLVAYSDPEPYDIGKALGVGE